METGIEGALLAAWAKNALLVSIVSYERKDIRLLFHLKFDNFQYPGQRNTHRKRQL